MKFIRKFLFFVFFFITQSEAIDNQSNENSSSIINQGWLNYVIVSKKSNELTKFEINKNYHLQFTSDYPNSKENKEFKDKFGYVNIPKETNFYFVLTKKTLYVLNERRVIYNFFSIGENFIFSFI